MPDNRVDRLKGETMNTEIKEKLNKLALLRSKPFCYSCYQSTPSGVCPKCHSDDLMRELPGVGVEYGLGWVVEHIVESELTEIDREQAFEDSLEGLYPETTQIGFIEYDTITAMKELDPVAFELAESEYIDSLLDDDQIVEIGSKYYWTSDVESLVEEIDLENAS